MKSSIILFAASALAMIAPSAAGDCEGKDIFFQIVARGGRSRGGAGLEYCTMFLIQHWEPRREVCRKKELWNVTKKCI